MRRNRKKKKNIQNTHSPWPCAPLCAYPTMATIHDDDNTKKCFYLFITLPFIHCNNKVNVLCVCVSLQSIKRQKFALLLLFSAFYAKNKKKTQKRTNTEKGQFVRQINKIPFFFLSSFDVRKIVFFSRSKICVRGAVASLARFVDIASNKSPFYLLLTHLFQKRTQTWCRDFDGFRALWKIKHLLCIV